MPSPNLPVDMTLEQLQAKIQSMYWHQGIDFGGGLQTNSTDSIERTSRFGQLLFDGIELKGKSVLDIGAWNGAYSFAAARQGAARVVACDKYVWTHPHFRGRETFELARRLLGLEVEAYEIDLPDVSAALLGTFDIVLFSGVFYHLLEAVRLTRQIASCAAHLLVVETHQDALDNPRPAMIFYPGETLEGDASNWWGPNPHCMFELLTEFGFTAILYRDTPGFEHGGRGLYHAYRSLDSMRALGVHEPPPGWISLSEPAARQRLFAPR